MKHMKEGHAIMHSGLCIGLTSDDGNVCRAKAAQGATQFVRPESSARREHGYTSSLAASRVISQKLA